jgi:hypothetical protein
VNGTSIFLAALLYVFKDIEDDGLEGVELLKESLQLEVILSLQQPVY